MADLLLHISADGTSSGAKTEVECQDALNITTGKGVSIKKYKNCQHTTQSDAGFQVSTSFGPEAPLGAGQALLWAAHDSGDRTYFWIEDSDTGGMIFEGPCKLAIGDISSPTNDEKVHSLTLGADGDVTRSATV